jgi:hypothetical protein
MEASTTPLIPNKISNDQPRDKSPTTPLLKQQPPPWLLIKLAHQSVKAFAGSMMKMGGICLAGGLGLGWTGVGSIGIPIGAVLLSVGGILWLASTVASAYLRNENQESLGRHLVKSANWGVLGLVGGCVYALCATCLDDSEGYKPVFGYIPTNQQFEEQILKLGALRERLRDINVTQKRDEMWQVGETQYVFDGTSKTYASLLEEINRLNTKVTFYGQG